MSFLNNLNIKEIETIKSIFGISFDRSKDIFKLKGPVSTKLVIDLYQELKNNIWNTSNIKQALSELNETTTKTRLMYFNPGYPSAIDGYLSKVGLLNYDVLIEDPLCFPLTVKPDFEGHILKKPDSYLKHMFENAAYMVYLEEWVRKGYLYFVPSIPLFDPEAFWTLSDINIKADRKSNIENNIKFQKSINYSMTESKARFSVDMLRMSKDNYTIENIKKIFPNANNVELKKYFEMFKSSTLEEREENAVSHAILNSNLPSNEKDKIILDFKRSQPFNIERYLDVTNLKSSFIQKTGMPFIHATFLSDVMHCVPSTDNLGLIYGYEGWCEILNEKTGVDFDKTRIKIDLPFPYLENASINFVKQERESLRALKTSTYLEDEWNKIINTGNVTDFVSASQKFRDKVEIEVKDLDNQAKLIEKDLITDLKKTGIIGATTLISASLTTNIPLGILGSLTAIYGSLLDNKKNYKRNKQELYLKPLSLFVDTKDKFNK